MTVGSAAAVIAIDCAEPTAPMANSLVCTPVIAFELTMNCRSEPCCWMPALAASRSVLSPRVLVTTLNEKPESMPVAAAPESATRVTCSAVDTAEASSAVAAVLPPYSVPAVARKPAPCAAPATP